MATIRIKRSTETAAPTSLAPGEPAFSELSGSLFVGGAGGTPLRIGQRIEFVTEYPDPEIEGVLYILMPEA